MIHLVLGFVRLSQCTQRQTNLITLESKSLNVKLHFVDAFAAMAINWKILMTMESKSLNVKLHLVDVHAAMAIIWTIAKKSLTTD